MTTTISALTNDLAKSITSTLLPLISKYLEDEHKVKVGAETLAKVLSFEYKVPMSTPQSLSSSGQGLATLSSLSSLPLSSTPQSVPTVPRARSSAAKTGKCIEMITRGPKKGEKCDKSCVGNYCPYHIKKSDKDKSGKKESKKSDSSVSTSISNALLSIQNSQPRNESRYKAHNIEGSTTDQYVEIDGVKAVISPTSDGTYKFVSIVARSHSNNGVMVIDEFRDPTSSEREILKRNYVVFPSSSGPGPSVSLPGPSTGLSLPTPSSSVLSSLSQHLGALSLGAPPGLNTIQ